MTITKPHTLDPGCPPAVCSPRRAFSDNPFVARREPGRVCDAQARRPRTRILSFLTTHGLRPGRHLFLLSGDDVAGLALTRKVGEEIVCSGSASVPWSLSIVVAAVEGNRAELVVNAPAGIAVDRREVLDRIHRGERRRRIR